MSDEIKVVYGFCQDNCKYPVYTKEDVIGLLQYVIEHNELPSDIVNGNYDSTQGLVAVNSVVEQNKGKAMQFFLGTQAEYDAYTGDKTNLFSVITDDQTKKSIMDTLSQHASSINGMIDGKISVNKASNANKINDIEITKDEYGVLRVGDTIIPQKKLLWSGEKSIGDDGQVILGETVSSVRKKNLPEKTTFQIIFRTENSRKTYMFPMGVDNTLWGNIQGSNYVVEGYSNGSIMGFEIVRIDCKAYEGDYEFAFVHKYFYTVFAFFYVGRLLVVL